MRALLAFVRLARLPFLAGGFAGFALGAATARYDGAALSLAPYLWGQGLVTAFHLMVHFANDYFDQASDALTERTAWSGGSGVLTAGELAPRVALIAALACAACGIALIARAALLGNFTLAAVGSAIAVFAWSYSAPPARLLARGVGEADTVLVVAVLVPLAGYATFAHTLGAHALLATVPGGAAMFAMMLAVELPDRAADAATGKRNLVVRLGERRASRYLRLAACGAIAALAFGVRAVFGGPGSVELAALPAVAIAALLIVPSRHARPLVATPFLGVMLYGATALGASAMIAFAR